jgi:AcrR family transcriptional regulator
VPQGVKSEKATKPMAKSAATRRRVLHAAAKVLIENGYAGTRLGDIAEVADLQAGSLYYYFKSKEQLVEEVFNYGVRFTQAHVRTAVEHLPEGSPPGVRLKTALDAQLEAMLELGDLHAAHVLTYDQLPAELRERLRPARRAFSKFWTELVGDAIEAGEIRSDVDPYLVQLFIVNSLYRVPEWQTRTRHSGESLSRMVQGMIFNGVGAPDRPEATTSFPRALS